MSKHSVTTRGLRVVTTSWSWAWWNRTSPSKWVGLGSPLAACSVYGDLICSVHTVNNLCMFNCQCHFYLCNRGPYVRLAFVCLFVCLCWGLTSQLTIFQSCRDGATASWVINQYFRGVKCLAQGHNTAAVGLEPPTSRSGVRHSTTEPPRSPDWHSCQICYPLEIKILLLLLL